MIFDAHLDLSLNAIGFNRDLRLPVETIRSGEAGMTDFKGRGGGVVAFPEMRRGGVGICVATQIAGCMKPGAVAAGWNSPEQAWAMTQAQLAWYHTMEEAGEMIMLRDLAGFDEQLALWSGNTTPPNAPIGFILSLEGADSILTPDRMEQAWKQGLRAVGPAHYGEGRYALGHDLSGPLKPAGRELIREIDRLGMILDVTHLCDETFRQALGLFDGPVWASHSNCRSIVPDPRQFSDRQIRTLIERDAVIGMAFDAWMIVPGWIKQQTTPESAGVRIEHIVNHIDLICQLAGNARHVGIGSDLDGGFGREQCPLDLHTIADLTNVADHLKRRGYDDQDIDGIMHGNFTRFVRRAWGGA